MKKLFIIVILIFLNACTFVKYKSVSNPIIEMPNNEYLITNKNMKYENALTKLEGIFFYLVASPY